MKPEPQEPAPAAESEPTGSRESWRSSILRAGIAIADGTPFDWGSVERLARGPGQQAQLRELQQIARVARRCRDAHAEAGITPPDVGEHVASMLRALVAGSGRRNPLFAPDEVIGNRYRVKSLLGRGGMGEVYEAWDDELGIPVALKTLHVESGRERAALRSLKQEAMLARAVVHPNVCRVYDLGCHGDAEDGVWFLTMEVLRGVTLARRLSELGKLKPAAALSWVEQMASGLEAAHQAGVVHLDFKSANVMLVGEPGSEQAVVTDFGLARGTRTTAGDGAGEGAGQGSGGPVGDRAPIAALVGTPAYMSPEQVRGEPAGPAADIYALGVVLYEMVTGKPPFTGGTAWEVANRRLAEEAPSPRGIVPELDARWAAVILRCLEREPSRRFAHADEVSRALTGQLAPAGGDGATPASPVPPTLPLEWDSFVGREVELDALRQAMAGGARLVTLAGAGGMGKTRLAVRYGWQSREDWAGGTWFCDLAEARDVDGIASAVSRSLGVPLGKVDPVERLGRAIAGRKRCLVILDNVEQVTEEATAVMSRWLERVGAAHFLITSRRRLGLAEEELLNLEPLETEPSFQLFMERAKRLRPGLELGQAELAAVREVVRLVEGIPLAIELAAARMRVMSAAQLVSGMRKRFRLLTGGRSERHETLMAAIDGSWELLKPWEKAALAQCSVFEGGFPLEAAESVLDLSAYPGGPPVLDVLQSLTDRSLCKVSIPDGFRGHRAPRFGMYMSIQEYAKAKLAEEGAVPHGGSGAQAVRAAEERHGRWYRGFGAEKELVALDQPGGIERRRSLEREIDNLVAACRRGAARGDGETTRSAYQAIWAVISIRGPFRIAVDLGQEVIAAALGDEEKVTILGTLGQAEQSSGRLAEAQDRFERALAIHREKGDRSGEGAALGKLGALYHETARMEEARLCFERALPLLREGGNRRTEAVVLGNLGNLHRDQGRLGEARAHYEAALAIHRELGNRRSEGVAIGNLGGLLMEEGRMEEARRELEAALAIHREIGNRLFEVTALMMLGGMDRTQGRFEDARGRFEEALVIDREIGERRGEGALLLNLGIMDQERGRFGEARERYEDSLAVFQDVGDQRWEGVVLGNLASLRLAEGLIEEALPRFEAAIAILREVGDRRSEGINHGILGKLFLDQGRIEEARGSLARGEALLRAAQNRSELAVLLCTRAELEHGSGNVAAAQSVLDEVEAVAAQVGSGEDSDLGRKLQKIRQMLTVS